uniref:Putative secreted peptide n=1 Tax=Anopheles braziliensis TaxID=58242 RepID=A0A2M3ZP28_9DIPT
MSHKVGHFLLSLFIHYSFLNASATLTPPLRSSNTAHIANQRICLIKPLREGFSCISIICTSWDTLPSYNHHL